MHKKAVVTGGSRGIGRGIVECLASEKYDVFFSYHGEKEKAIEYARELEVKYLVKVGCAQASLQNKGDAEKLLKTAIAFLGGLDLHVNNAGITYFGHILDMDIDDIENLINLDFKSYIEGMHFAAKYMVETGVKGSIINITSTRAQRAYPEDSIYGGIKAGIERVVKGAALDLAPYGIRVNCIAPGAICVRTKEELQKKRDIPVPDDFWEKLGRRIPLGRNGMPRDIGAAVAFLASDKAGYITGTTLTVDGGISLPGMPESEESKNTGWGYHLGKRENR